MKTQPHLQKIPALATRALIAFSALLLSGCAKEEATKPTTITIYAAGANQVGPLLEPCYWKNDTRIDLPGLDPYEKGTIRDIHVVKNTVYTAGYARNSMGKVPCYWIDDAIIKLPVLDPTKDGQVEAVKVIGENIFTAGHSINNADISVPCYWINKDRVDLPVLDPTQNGFVLGMDVLVNAAENTIYMAGYVRNAGIYVPCYWRNDTLVVLPVLDPTKSGYAYAIQIVENDIYIAGYTLNNAGINIPCYWINGTRIDLSIPSETINPDGPVQGYAYAIHVVGNDIYAAGRIADLSSSYPCYWINNVIVVNVFSAGESSTVRDMQVVGDTVFMVGDLTNDSSVQVPCYWINHDTRIDLPVLDPTKHGFAKAIQVVVE